jgi:hypothetical protein
MHFEEALQEVLVLTHNPTKSTKSGPGLFWGSFNSSRFRAGLRSPHPNSVRGPAGCAFGAGPDWAGANGVGENTQLSVAAAGALQGPREGAARGGPDWLSVGTHEGTGGANLSGGQVMMIMMMSCEERMWFMMLDGFMVYSFPRKRSFEGSRDKRTNSTPQSTPLLSLLKY